ncbi:MAG: hypothetical protein DHS20C18_47520 [Saprospiraceae bacterium]|nr:MAG: hypothetical protein DHS20C18_47520 [Saprospiraceae bacterium]
MLKRTSILLLSSIFLLAATCERDVDLGFDDPEPRLVVFSNFSNTGEIRVQVSKSKSALDNTADEYISDAKVEIYAKGQLIERLKLVVPESGRIPPYYATRGLVPEVNVVYMIKVDADGFETIRAESTIPEQIAVNFFEISELMISQDEEERTYSYRVRMNFDDPVTEKNYYHLNIFQQIQEYVGGIGDTVITGISYRPVEFNPKNNKNDMVAYLGGGLLLEDDPLNGDYDFNLSVSIDPTTQILGKVFVEFRTVSEDYYLYHASITRQNFSEGSSFAEPVFVYNNIENGHGVFAGYITSIDSLLIIQ